MHNVWITGFGLHITPAGIPFRMGVGHVPASLDVVLDRGSAEWLVRVVADGDGGFNTMVEHAAPSVDAVVAIAQSDDRAEAWTLHCTTGGRGYSVPLPGGLVALSGEPGAPAVVELVGPGGALYMVQMPRALPPPTAWVGPGQTLVGTATAHRGHVATVAYDVAGEAWQQRHESVEDGACALLLTAQAPADSAAAMNNTAVELAAGLSPIA